MAEKKKMSVAEILAAARKTDADGAGEAEPPPVEAAPTEKTATEKTGTEATGTEANPAEAAAADAAAAEASPPAKPVAAKSASGGRPSVAEMMAMARGEKGGGEKKPAASAEGKASALTSGSATSGSATSGSAKSGSATSGTAGKKPVASKGSVAAKAAVKEPRDTASILAAARKSTKAGPMSKAEAAAKAKADPTVKAKPKVVVPPMPEKPAYAKPATVAKGPKGKPAKGAAKQERRSFMSVGFGALAAVTLLWSLASLKFLFPNVRREPPSKFKVGFPDAYPAGQVQTKFKAQYGVWVSNAEYNGEQQIYALKSVCTHLGCTPSWLDAEQKFKCPCHGSGFYKDGINFEGPAPRPLERCAIRIADDGQIEIDKSRTFQEEMGQWQDQACYISV